MPAKRKRSRSRSRNAVEGDQKRQRVSTPSSGKEAVVRQGLLNRYYAKVLTLREYLLSRLPVHSKIRRKKILLLGRKDGDKEKDQRLAQFLDRTLIGVSKDSAGAEEDRWRQWPSFSQRPDDSDISLANLSGAGVFSQSEIVDFAIWLLFQKSQGIQNRSQHLLCQGYRKDISSRAMNDGENAKSSIPGVVSIYPNRHVTIFRESPWPQILALMGRSGEKWMVDLILDCGIFLAIDHTRGTYHQLSGQPLTDLQILPPPNTVSLPGPKPRETISTTSRNPSSINFVRSRMLYARPALNAQGSVRFGLRHIHVLNRYPNGDPTSECPVGKDGAIAKFNPTNHTIMVMMYIFPRQFGLHNVFTCEVDPQQTVQPFKDYTLREDEMKLKNQEFKRPRIPTRLAGMAAYLVHRMQVSHKRCAYKKLLDHYCVAFDKSSRDALSASFPSQDASSKFETQCTVSTGSIEPPTFTNRANLSPPKGTMMDHATPTANVSAFCRAVFSHLIPSAFWGNGDAQKQNEQMFHRNIDHFIRLRRFETLSLHEVSQGIKISEIPWLGILDPSDRKRSQSDTNKRREIFHEFLYYLFDSLLIPLIRANFHVTESNVDRYRLFYFRHDVWRTIAEPALMSLKVNMFEEIKLEKATKILDSRKLGFSQVRLLPKETGVRPIMNLRRRVAKKGSQNLLGSSINSLLAPVYNVLNYEKAQNPARLGSTLFSVGDLYKKLKIFKSRLIPSSRPLYFAKLDVHAAFDTIPQAAVLALISSLPTESEYRISKHVEIKPGENYLSDPKSKPTRKWTALAHSPDDFMDFEESLENSLAVDQKNTIFVENIVNQFRDTDDLLSLLNDHVLNNMVKIGKKFYRQKEGIPQGSVLSSLLCNYFYADLEEKHLNFLSSSESLLLRLIDDFLLITINPEHAKRFLEVMQRGLPAYGVKCNADKTLVNFEVVVNGRKVPRLVGKRTCFPYCGSFIDTQTLDISRDRERRKDKAIADSLTVEFSKVPGKTFLRKVLNTFKIQSHAMFLDTSFNSTKTVIVNVYTAFIETATKMWTYAKCLPPAKQPGTKLITKTITSLINLALVLLKSKSKSRSANTYKCSLNKPQIEFLAYAAFKNVLVKKQSRYRDAITWLNEQLAGLRDQREKMKGINHHKRLNFQMINP